VNEPGYSDERGRQKVFVLPNSRLVVGRGPECDIVIHDAAASRRQAAFSTDKTHLFVETMGARTLIQVNGALMLEDRVLLRNGDFVTMGATRFEVVLLS
jgi:pSer/pThr/pTyr-binding forkhead associated (FHA) protein